MNDSLFYISVIVLVLLFFIYGYIRIKYGFWYYQPVFHVYNFWYYFFPCGIIEHGLPEKNRFTNTDRIQFLSLESSNESSLDKCIHLIQNNYLKNNENIFNPEKNNIIKYFSGHNTSKYPCFLSLYWENEWVHDLKNSGEFIKHEKLVGMMTTRPLYVKFNKDKSGLVAYYVDYLCVHKDYRKKGYAPQIIQTHHYNQRHKNPQVHASLFKRENELTGIVPLTVYSTIGFSMKGWKKPLEVHTADKILECSSQNMRYLLEFMKETEDMFDITITPEVANILELIQSRNIYIYFVLDTSCDQVMAAYFFRNTCVSINKDCKILNCFASICRENYNEEAFAYGFKTSIFMIPMMDYLFLAVEDMSHNKKIIENLQKKNKISATTPSAYFFYNFAYPTFPSSRVLIVN
jgi:hypothetical protein